MSRINFLLSILFADTMTHFSFENTVAELTRLDAPLNVKPPTGWRRRPPSFAEGLYSQKMRYGAYLVIFDDNKGILHKF